MRSEGLPSWGESIRAFRKIRFSVDFSSSDTLQPLIGQVNEKIKKQYGPIAETFDNQQVFELLLRAYLDNTP